MQLADLISGIAQYASDGIFIAERAGYSSGAGTLVWCNDALCKISGYDAAEILGAPCDVFLGLSECEDTAAGILKTLAEGAPVREHVANKTKTGQTYTADLFFRPLPMRPGGKQFWLGFLHHDFQVERIREGLDHARGEAALSNRRLWDAIDALPDAFVMYDKEDRLVVCNNRYKEFYAKSAPAIFPGAKFQDIMRYGLQHGQYPEAKGNEAAWFEDILARFRGSTKPIDRVLSDGRHIVIHDVETENGDIVGLRTDVTELRRQQRQLRVQAEALDNARRSAEVASRTDALTGVANRRGLELFLDLLERRLPQNRQVALLHFDLDRFKAINDTYGHPAGDAVLCALSGILRTHARYRDYVARVGGDEFVVVLPSRNAEADASKFADRVLSDCARGVMFEGTKLGLATSVGIAAAAGSEVAELVSRSDAALYKAKELGRGRQVAFTPDLLAMDQEKRALSSDLEAAITNCDIQPYFQPQVSARDFTMMGAEALARWHHTDRGFVPPSSFLPLAEEMGLLAELDRHILDQGLRMVADLAEAGVVLPKLSLNVGAHRLNSSDLPKQLRDLKPWPCHVALELLETIDFDTEDNGNRWTITECRNEGALIEMDDFGSGSSSLTALIGLQPDRVKIDRRITATVDSQAREGSPMVKAICEMAKALGIKVTAEGVETQAQAVELNRLGCDALQGFLFAPALSGQDFLDWHNQHKQSAELFHVTKSRG